MDWSAEAIERLRALWTEGLSTAEIGRRLGISKNAVVGKAHRLSLAARPSPIRRSADSDGLKRAAAVRRTVGPTLAPIEPPAPAPAPAPRPAAPPPAPPVLRSVARPSGGRSVSCCWPIGEPGTKSFRFCDVGSLPNKPYCAQHAALAYVRVRDRREDAA